MPYRIITYDRLPPGQFWYQQTEGISKTFGGTPSIEELAKKISRFRSGNSLPRADYLSCLEDIDSFTCARLNNNTAFVYQTDRPFDQLHPGLGGGGCATCGATLSP